MSFGGVKPALSKLGRSALGCEVETENERLEATERVQVTARGHFSKAELFEANRAVCAKMEAQISLSANFAFVDLARQTKVEQAQFTPLTFIPSRSVSLPQGLLNAMQEARCSEPVTFISKRHPIVYFGVETTLFVWDFKQSASAQPVQTLVPGLQRKQSKPQLVDMVQSFACNGFITSIVELNSVNQRSGWQIATEAAVDMRYVLVATDRRIQLLTMRRVPNSHELSVQEQGLQPLEQIQTRVLVEFEKLGRVFYARPGGKVSELKFENSAVVANHSLLSSITSLVLPTRKRLNRVDHQKENILIRVIPDFMKLTRQNAEIKQLKVDEQRNLLYSLALTD